MGGRFFGMKEWEEGEKGVDGGMVGGGWGRRDGGRGLGMEERREGIAWGCRRGGEREGGILFGMKG